MFFSMILGIVGLLILVMIHELGHFVFARIAKINVEVFSLGFGPKIWKKTIKGVEYALSLFPLGGYCKMSGETLVEGQSPKPGEMYYGAVWRRALAVIGGPLFSFLGGWLFFIFAAPLPHTLDFTAPKIVLQKADLPQAIAQVDPLSYGFLDGDIITHINGKKIDRFDEVFTQVALGARRELSFDIQRGSQLVTIKQTPVLLPDGRGYLPIFPWYDPIITQVLEDSAAQKAGILAGDFVLSVNQTPIQNTLELSQLIRNAQEPLLLQIKRGTQVLSLSITPQMNEDLQRKTIGVLLGKMDVRTVDGYHGVQILTRGTAELTRSVRLYMWGLSHLFHGMNPLKALSGPVQNTYIIGEVAKSSVATDSQGVKSWSLYNIFTLLGFISVALGIMNLLPIPLLDGGLLVLYAIEAIRGKYLSARSLRIYQYIGLSFIFFLLCLALLSDVLFVLRQ